mmetsp:Transcript_6827/g.21347  ORF Transcript_6827/g.21347 Transcript_6827/m.21347 type:complete len:100 (+) Transcript_6827:1440-1739(+)
MPVTADWNPKLPTGFQSKIRRFYRTLQHTGERGQKGYVVRSDEAAGHISIALAFCCQGDIHPTRESVFRIPYALPVSHQNEKNVIIWIKLYFIRSSANS